MKETETYRCAVCGEPISMLDIEHGNIAEMYDPSDGELHSGIVHTECGLSRGWEVS
jgi:hypothetical protein